METFTSHPNGDDFWVVHPTYLRWLTVSSPKFFETLPLLIPMGTRVFLATCDLWVLGVLEDEQLRSLEKSWRGMRWCRRLRLLAQAAGGLSERRKNLGCFYQEMEYQRMSRYGECA